MFEWGILTCIVLVLMGLFLRKAQHLQAEAERLNVQATVNNLRAAVLLAAVLPKYKKSVCSEGRSGGNPVALLKMETNLELDGYLGDLTNPDLNQIAPGKWYFDRSQGALIYRLRNAAGFTSPLSGPPRIRLCLRRKDISESGDSPLRLESCESYRWVSTD